MKYVQSRSNFSVSKKNSSNGKGRIWIVGGLVLILAIVIIVFVMRKPALMIENSESDIESTIGEETSETALLEAESATTYEEVALEYVGTIEGEWHGVARRGEKGKLFTHVVVATLPPIDHSTEFYEGWLVKPRVVEFFSTGEMFARADGKWGLVWESETSEALFDYSDVVITLEPRDGNSAPSSEHVLEGSF